MGLFYECSSTAPSVNKTEYFSSAWPTRQLCRRRPAHQMTRAFDSTRCRASPLALAHRLASPPPPPTSVLPAPANWCPPASSPRYRWVDARCLCLLRPGLVSPPIAMVPRRGPRICAVLAAGLSPSLAAAPVLLLLLHCLFFLRVENRAIPSLFKASGVGGRDDRPDGLLPLRTQIRPSAAPLAAVLLWVWNDVPWRSIWDWIGWFLPLQVRMP